MKILLLAIGRRHDPDLKAAIETYTGRINHYAPAAWQLLEPSKGKMDEATTRRTESEALAKELQPDDYVILLDERGKQLASPDLARLLELQQQQATRRLVFIIGGAYGVDQTLRQRAQLVWSLSPLVFPHQLVRLILTEQLYRGFTIVGGEPYHHE